MRHVDTWRSVIGWSSVGFRARAMESNSDHRLRLSRRVARERTPSTALTGPTSGARVSLTECDIESRAATSSRLTSSRWDRGKLIRLLEKPGNGDKSRVEEGVLI